MTDLITPIVGGAFVSGAFLVLGVVVGHFLTSHRSRESEERAARERQEADVRAAEERRQDQDRAAEERRHAAEREYAERRAQDESQRQRALVEWTRQVRLDTYLEALEVSNQMFQALQRQFAAQQAGEASAVGGSIDALVAGARVQHRVMLVGSPDTQTAWSTYSLWAGATALKDPPADTWVQQMAVLHKGFQAAARKDLQLPEIPDEANPGLAAFTVATEIESLLLDKIRNGDPPTPGDG